MSYTPKASYVSPADLSIVQGDIADLTTLTGVGNNATDLGTFPGTTITDAVDVKTALQELETAVEAINPDGNNTPVVRGNATTGAQPTALEVPAPVAGDTAGVFLTDGTLERWVYDGTNWSLAYTLDANQATNLALGTLTATTVPVTNTNGTGFTLPEATVTLAGALSATDKAELVRQKTWQTATATTTLLATEKGVIMNNTAAATVTLPDPATVEGCEFHVKDGNLNAATNNITVETPGAETIDGAANHVIDLNGLSRKFVAVGGEYFII